MRGELLAAVTGSHGAGQQHLGNVEASRAGAHVPVAATVAGPAPPDDEKMPGRVTVRLQATIFLSEGVADRCGVGGALSADPPAFLRTAGGEVIRLKAGAVYSPVNALGQGKERVGQSY